MLQRNIKRIAITGAALTAMSLSGCKMAVMDPMGPIGAQEKDLILLSTSLMLLVVIPVILMTLWFGWRYRASNRKATYAPEWEHSTRIEAVVWAIPCLIILGLATITWISTHQLDPYKPLTTANKAKPVEAASGADHSANCFQRPSCKSFRMSTARAAPPVWAHSFR